MEAGWQKQVEQCDEAPERSFEALIRNAVTN